MPGKRAKRENGRAKAIAKPSMPSVGARSDLPAASTRRVPMIGPVQLKLTITNVKAMNRIDRNPPVEEALLSSLVDQEAGRVSSKAPKKEAAKSSSKAKKMRLTTALVDSALRADAPKMTVISRPKPT